MYCSSACGNKAAYNRYYLEAHPVPGNCKKCGNSFTTRRQKDYCSASCKSKACKSKGRNNSQAQSNRGYLRKEKLVADMGGGCVVCNYSKSLRSLTFHHKEPSKKEYRLDIRTLSGMSIERITSEAAKCALLCHNCHNELHEDAEKLCRCR
jgi:hypothetical protein